MLQLVIRDLLLFLSRRAVRAAAFAVMACAASSALARPAPPSVEDFLHESAIGNAQLSPSGRYVAFVRSESDQDILIVLDRKTHSSRALFAAKWVSKGVRDPIHDKVRISDLNWKTDDRIVVTSRVLLGFNPRPNVVWVESLSLTSIERQSGVATYLTRVAPGSATGIESTKVLDGLASDPDHILVYRYDKGRMAVDKVDVRTAAREEVAPFEVGVLAYKVDRSGSLTARIRQRIGHGWRVIEGRAPGQTTWTEVAQIQSHDLRALSEFEFLGAADRPAAFYVAIRPKGAADGDTTSIHMYDFATKTLGPSIRSHPKYDVIDVVQNADGELLAGCYWADTYQCDFSDKQLAKVMAGLSNFFDGQRSIFVTSMSDDGAIWLLYVSGPDEPGSYYIYDNVSKKVDLLGVQNPALKIDALAPMERFDYTGIEGTMLHGYFSRLPSAGVKPPLIVMPHGGPEARDHYDYDQWTQFFASRGYAVFQPNFRGSDGFGRSFAEAGYGQWGGRMQQDITDGVQALIAAGKVDPHRICIVGASYGGYAALYGPIGAPSLYRCAISVAGVSDLPKMLSWEKRIFGADSDRYEYWTKSMGDPVSDAARLERFSPARRASEVDVPVLLLHGDDDWTVPDEQSKVMERALKKAGKPVKLVIVPGAGHGGWDEKQNVTILTAMESFLSESLRPTDSDASTQ